AAMALRVFLTTENLVSWPSATRSSLSCATVSPRYSVRTAAFDSLKSLVISATAETLLGVVITLLPGNKAGLPGPRSRELKLKTPRADARGLAQHSVALRRLASFTCVGRPMFRVLRQGMHFVLRGVAAELSCARKSGFPSTDGLWYFKVTGEGSANQIDAAAPRWDACLATPTT